MKNQIKKYLIKLKEKHPEIIDDKKINKTIDLLTKDLYNFENIKTIIDILLDKEIEIYQYRLNKMQACYQNKLKDNRESRSFSQIKDAYEKLDSLVSYEDFDLILCGGIVPYLLLNEDSNRLHDDIDTICRLEDMPKIRKVFKKVGLYDKAWDSLSFAKNKKDYGFEIKINDVPIGIYPYTYMDELLIQYSYDPYNTKCKEKVININLKDYIKTYKSVDGKKYKTQCLEIIKKSKDAAGREKDKIDSKKITQYGINETIYESISLPKEIVNKPAKELN